MCPLRFLVLAGLLAATSAARVTWEETEGFPFERFEKEFGRSFASAEERAQRRALFEARRSEAIEHNADPSRGWKRTLNDFSDRTESELAHLHGLDRSLSFWQRSAAFAAPDGRRPAPRHLLDGGVDGLPAAVDWRAHTPSVVTAVKNQGSCGSCWTFASTETLESQWALRTGRGVQDLSEQFVLDCTPNPHDCGGSGGCGGGTAELAYARLRELGGQPSEWTYPYISGTGQPGTCHGLPMAPEHPHSGSVMSAANVTGHVSVPSNSYKAMLRAVAAIGPLAISVDAGAWHDYAGGVFSGGNHTNPTLDHLVQLVGYGTDAATKQDYWLVRNSWTPEWGEEGYIRLARSATPTCGTDLNPLDGNGCTGGPPQVEVCGQSGMLFDGVYPLVV